MESLQASRTPALGGESAVTDEETNRSSVLTTALKFPVVLFTHSAYRTLSKLLIRAVSLKTTGNFPVTLLMNKCVKYLIWLGLNLAKCSN